MNHPTEEEIEKLLERLTPTPPDAALMGRLQSSMPGRSKIVPMLRWTALAAAAAIAMVAALSTHRPPAPVAIHAPSPAASTMEPPVKVPLESVQHLMEVKDLGVVEDSSRNPFRLIRTTWLDEIYYATEPDGAPVKEARIRQEVLPVSLTNY
jgi:hypothetical protein